MEAKYKIVILVCSVVVVVLAIFLGLYFGLKPNDSQDYKDSVQEYAPTPDQEDKEEQTYVPINLPEADPIIYDIDPPMAPPILQEEDDEKKEAPKDPPILQEEDDEKKEAPKDPPSNTIEDIFRPLTDLFNNASRGDGQNWYVRSGDIVHVTANNSYLRIRGNGEVSLGNRGAPSRWRIESLSGNDGDILRENESFRLVNESTGQRLRYGATEWEWGIFGSRPSCRAFVGDRGMANQRTDQFRATGRPNDVQVLNSGKHDLMRYTRRYTIVPMNLIDLARATDPCHRTIYQSDMAGRGLGEMGSLVGLCSRESNAECSPSSWQFRRIE